jgi:hypothetical protein
VKHRSNPSAAIALMLMFLPACSEDPAPAPGGTGGTGGSTPAATDGSAPGADSGRRPDASAAPSAAMPASASQMDIEAFLAADGYKAAPWISETPGPRAKGSGTSPHDRVRVWMNPELVTSLKAGRDGFKDPMTMLNHPPHDMNSMAVKELYAEDDTLVGLAAMIKTEVGGSLNSWTYFCYGPEGRCLTGQKTPKETPAFGKGFGVACGFCHGGLIYTKPPQ